MVARAYYNEIDPYAAEWLRNLIDAGHIAFGDVDERDIRDVHPSDLDGYAQCHFFAGVGIWSAALRVAGWPDDRPVWTGSCPCQPFSAAGGRAGFDDERHLWPAWHWLIEQCRPETVLAEQVASKDGLGWSDLVASDLDGTDYALGFLDTCAAGAGSFHIRQRLYAAATDNRPADREAWRAVVRDFGGVPDAPGARSLPGAQPGLRGSEESGRAWNGQPQRSGAVGGLGHPDGGHPGAEREQRGGEFGLQPGRGGGAKRLDNGGGDGRGTRGNGDHAGHERIEPAANGGRGEPWWERDRADLLPDAPDALGRAADWLWCRDGRWRPVGPGTFPLAHASSARMGRLRAYGNGLDLAQAAGFIRAFMERDRADPIAGNLFEWGT